MPLAGRKRVVDWRLGCFPAFGQTRREDALNLMTVVVAYRQLHLKGLAGLSVDVKPKFIVEGSPGLIRHRNN